MQFNWWIASFSFSWKSPLQLIWLCCRCFGHKRLTNTGYICLHDNQRTKSYNVDTLTIPMMNGLLDNVWLVWWILVFYWIFPYRCTVHTLTWLISILSAMANGMIMKLVWFIFRILRPGAIWVNLGPLLYHYSDVSGEGSIEPSYEDLLLIIRGVGFTILVSYQIHFKLLSGLVSFQFHGFQLFNTFQFDSIQL